MKNLPIIKLTKPWSPPLSIVALTCTLLFTLALRPLQAQVLITDFEASEGFQAGQTASGKAGWTNGNANFLIASDHVHSGSQSLRVEADPNKRLDGPIIVDQGFSGVSLWLSNPETVPAASANFIRFRIYIGEESGSQGTVQFQLHYASDPDGATYGINYSDGTSGGAKSKYFSKSLLNPMEWTEFRFEADFSNLTYSVWLGETELLAGIPIGGEVTSNSSIYQIRFYGHTVSQQGAAYYDHITGFTSIPEPSAAMLFGGSLCAGLIIWVRRRKIVA